MASTSAVTLDQTVSEAGASTLPRPPPPAPLKPKHHFKLVIIGDASVGKTALRQRYLSNGFHQNYRATIGVDFMVKTILIDEILVSLQIWDTAGQERFRSLGTSFYRGSDGCLLLYSNKESLDSLTGWFQEFKNKAPIEQEELKDFAWCAVGCKTDLWGKNGMQAVKEEEARNVLDNLLPRTSDGKELDKNVSAYHIPGNETNQTENSSSSPKPNFTSTDKFNTTASAACHPYPQHTTAIPNKRSIDILPALRPSPPVQTSAHHPRLRSKRFTASNGSLGTMGTTKSIYHTPSSSLHQSLSSYASAADTIKPSDFTRNRNGKNRTSGPIHADEGLGEESEEESEDDDENDSDASDEFSWQVTEEVSNSEQTREARRGIDPYLATSPPHAPPGLGSATRPPTTYIGGPPVLQQNPALSPAVHKNIAKIGSMAELTNGNLENDSANKKISTTTAISALHSLQDYNFAEDGIAHFTTSAKTGSGVTDVFEYVARRMLARVEKLQRELDQAGTRKAGFGTSGSVVQLKSDGSVKTKKKNWADACCS